MFAAKPNLRDCGVCIVASALVPKTVYHFAFGKATVVAAVEETERGYGGIIRQSLGVAKGFPWNVLSGSLEFDGLGALQLATEVAKTRLRQFQSMITSSATADCIVAMAMVSLAQRWCGSSTPVNMLSADELHLLEPLDAAAFPRLEADPAGYGGLLDGPEENAESDGERLARFAALAPPPPPADPRTTSARLLERLSLHIADLGRAHDALDATLPDADSGA